MNANATEDLIRLAHDWDLAMVANDADAIGAFMTEDWKIVGSDGAVVDQETFLGLVREGALSHDVMESHELEARIVGDVGMTLCRGVSGGEFRGRQFHDVERVSCVFIRQDGSWRCALTHLSRIDAEPDPA